MTAALQAALAACNTRAGPVVRNQVNAGAAAYDRARDLPKLIHIPDDPADIVPALQMALAAARAGAAKGHWAADQNRVIALRQALAAAERAMARKEAA